VTSIQLNTDKLTTQFLQRKLCCSVEVLPKKDPREAHMKPIDITGQRFGRLVVVEFAYKKGRRHFWMFQCNCGTKKTINKTSVMNKRTMSCGCYNREIVSKNQAKDLSNQRFHMLVAIEPVGKNKYGAVMWKCQCDCGNTSVVRGGALRTGVIKSCGCWNRTKKSGKESKN